MNLRIVRAGVLTSVQGAPRSGYRHSGIAPGGALDLVALRVLNLLTGNEPEIPLLEITAGSVRLTLEDSRLLAWGGGEYDVAANGKSLPAGHVALVEAGGEVSFAGPIKGLRAWLAISGGIDVPAVLGSPATDSRGRFGGWKGRALKDGDHLPLGNNSMRVASIIKSFSGRGLSSWSAPFEWAHSAILPPVLHFIRGKDWDLFEETSREAFTSSRFLVTSETDRMGIRVRGPVLRRKNESNLVSEAVVAGSVQVPPDGHPIVLLGDCQTIGGYPVMAHVISADLARAAQLPPQSDVFFQEVSVAEACSRLWQNECDLAKFRIGLEISRR